MWSGFEDGRRGERRNRVGVVRHLVPSARMGNSRRMRGSAPVMSSNSSVCVYCNLIRSSGIGSWGSHSGVLNSGVPSTAADPGYSRAAQTASS